jgi:hypothetical protein
MSFSDDAPSFVVIWVLTGVKEGNPTSASGRCHLQSRGLARIGRLLTRPDAVLHGEIAMAPI